MRVYLMPKKQGNKAERRVIMGRLGVTELVLILCIALVIFGPSKLPQIGRSLGEAIKEFKKGTESVRDEVNSVLDDVKDSTTKKKDA